MKGLRAIPTKGYLAKCACFKCIKAISQKKFGSHVIPRCELSKMHAENPRCYCGFSACMYKSLRDSLFGFGQIQEKSLGISRNERISVPFTFPRDSPAKRRAAGKASGTIFENRSRFRHMESLKVKADLISTGLGRRVMSMMRSISNPYVSRKKYRLCRLPALSRNLRASDTTKFSNMLPMSGSLDS